MVLLSTSPYSLVRGSPRSLLQVLWFPFTNLHLMKGVTERPEPNTFSNLLSFPYLDPLQKCPDPNCRVKKSLHGHHPRDCLFYLRDWDALRLQKLLQVRGLQG